MKPLSVQQAAARVGVHPDTIRTWADNGRLPFRRISERGDRRFAVADVDALIKGRKSTPLDGVRVALYVRVSGRGDQMTSLAMQERELRAELSDKMSVVKVFRDVGSGLSEKRKGLQRALRSAKRGGFDELHITHADRLARFGTLMMTELFEAYGVRVRVLHATDEDTPEAELMADFMALIASFSGRLYGQRSAAAKRRLLKRAGAA